MYPSLTEFLTVHDYLQNQAAPVVPSAPTSLAVSPQTTKNTLTWTNNGTYDKVLIERKDSGSYSQLALINSNTTYDDSTIVPPITYTYQVRALRNTYPSAYSSPVTISIFPNQGFELWTGGTTFNSITDSEPVADNWMARTDGSTQVVNVTRDGTNKTQGSYSLKVAITDVGDASGVWIQTQQGGFDMSSVAGKSIVLSADVKSDSPVNLQFNTNDNIYVSSTHPGDNTFHTLSTVASTAGDHLTQCEVVIGAAGTDNNAQNGTYYMDNCKLTVS